MAKKTITNKVAKATKQLSAPVYSQEGKTVGEVDLTAKLFDLPWNADLIHQVIVSMQSNQRANTAQVKTRGDVRGGGKKPWKQKGTGRARHGSIRSPIWKGGGVTHGPTTERNYERKINAKMKTKALLTVLSQKRRDGELIFLDQLSVPTPRTSVAQQLINKLSAIAGYGRLAYRQGKRALFLVPETSTALVKSFRNLPSAVIGETRNLNPLSAMTYKYLVLVSPEASLSVLSSRLSKAPAKS